MPAQILQIEELRDYLGVDPEKDVEIGQLRASAVEHLCRASGIDWHHREDIETFNEALRARVWLSYYGVRDAAKNTQFVQEYLDGLICSLQTCGKAVSDAV